MSHIQKQQIDNKFGRVVRVRISDGVYGNETNIYQHCYQQTWILCNRNQIRNHDEKGSKYRASILLTMRVSIGCVGLQCKAPILAAFYALSANKGVPPQSTQFKLRPDPRHIALTSKERNKTHQSQFQGVST